MLAPEWDKMADKAMEKFGQSGRVLVGKVDCDKESKGAFDTVCTYDRALESLEKDALRPKQTTHETTPRSEVRQRKHARAKHACTPI